MHSLLHVAVTANILACGQDSLSQDAMSYESFEQFHLPIAGAAFDRLAKMEAQREDNAETANPGETVIKTEEAEKQEEEGEENEADEDGPDEDDYEDDEYLQVLLLIFALAQYIVLSACFCSDIFSASCLVLSD